jgi:hypothetical protein
LTILYRFLLKFPAAFENPLIWELTAFGNSFMAALAAFSKILSQEQIKSIFKYLRNYKHKYHKNQKYCLIFADSKI